MMDLLITVVGIVLLVAGGEGLVRGAVGIARRAGISPFVIGLTVVGFGTSSPELVVSVDAVLSGAPGIAIGNIVGSNIANMMLIIGMAALIVPLAVHPDALRRDGLVMLAATVLFVAIAMVGGGITRLYGVGLLVLLFVYMGYSLWSDARRGSPAAALHGGEGEDIEVGLPDRAWALAGAVAVGLVLLIAGSRLAVIGATGLARSAGLSEEVIGLTLVAVGTSLPELAASLLAARRGHADVCVGNIIGSNIFNVLGIAGAAALAGPLTFSHAMLAFDLWALLVLTLVMMLFMLTGQRVMRWEGAVLLALYAGYIAVQF